MDTSSIIIGLAFGIVLGGAIVGGIVFTIARNGGRRLGYAEAQREALAGGLDPSVTRDAANAVLADALERLTAQSLEHQRALAERAATESARQERTVHAIVEPVDAKLAQLGETLNRIEAERSEQSGQLNERLGNLTALADILGRETRTLATAMKDNKARGTWGEMQLRRVVELAGMLEHCDFLTQQTVTGEDGRLRPDLVVTLPQGRSIVVDSKVPMSAYLDAVNADDPAIRRNHLAQHARDVAAHVTELQRRDYGSYVDGALDFVVMFVPGDTFLEAAFETNASWFEDSVAKGVFPASPGSLIALLRAIAYGWRQEQLAENAAEIADLGRELHERVATMATHLTKVGSSLTSATEAYNKAVGSIESRVLVTTRKLEAKGITSARDLPELTPVETSTRSFSAPELTEVADPTQPTDPA